MGDDGAGEPLNFWVAPEFGGKFRRYGLDHRMKLTEILLATFEALERAALK